MSSTVSVTSAARCTDVPPPAYTTPPDMAVAPPPLNRSSATTDAPARAASIAAHAPAPPKPTTTTSASESHAKGMAKTITCSSMGAMDEYDVIVVGSGAAGMTAALTAAHHGLRTVLIEKAAHYGGSTARSGGGVWIPNNDVLLAEGVPATPDSTSTYLKYITGDVVVDDMRAACLDNGPAMLRLVLATTPLRMRWVTDYSDYYPEAPGGLPTGRSLEPRPLNAA